MYYGCKKEKDDKRDYKMKIAKSVRLPESYVLDMPPVKDQGIVNSCVAHSLALTLEKVHSKDKLKFSTGFIYGYRPVGYSQDEGMYPREALKTVQKLGDVEKKYFDHNKEMPEIKAMLETNLVQLKPFAEKYKITGYSRIYTEQEIKECIFSGTPVPASIPVRSDLALDETNVIKDTTGVIGGYHMITFIGWNDKGLIFQNSWGKDFGADGIAVLPYGYDIDSAWAISTETNAITTYPSLLQTIIAIIKQIFKLK